tara:strand:+ start:54010 stop:54459 length:450 start_codon:yes stop_codon:yes gene_type:complete
MYIFAKLLHIFGFTIWIGGMFFAHNALRPIASTTLEPPLRLALLCGVMQKFFAWVWISIALILASGIYMMAQLGKPPLYITLMSAIGIAMMFIFAHIYFAANKKLKRAVAAQDWPAGATAMAQIRILIATNLILGLLTLAIAILGPLVI